PFGAEAASPGDRHVDALTRALHGDDDALDHLADDLLPLRLRRGRCVPQRRNILGEMSNRRTLLCRQAARLRAQRTVALLVKPLLCSELCFPLPFQLPRHEAVLRLAQVILSRGALCLVPGPFASLLPQLLQLRPL